MVVQQDGEWQAVVGIPLGASIGEHSLNVATAGEERAVTFEVHDREYESQYITLDNDRMVNPYKNDLHRSARKSALPG